MLETPPSEKSLVMPIPVDVLEAELLSLPQADRSRLVDRLLASLGHDREWEEAWADEADQREARIDNGQASWIDGPQALSRIRATLK
jgi:Putative addiction module component